MNGIKGARGWAIRRGKRKRAIFLAVALAALISALATGETVSWLTTGTVPMENTFAHAQVKCAVDETFDAQSMRMTNVRVLNTGDAPAYIRVRLVSHRQNVDGETIGGAATLPDFTPGTGWESVGNYYYYADPVPAGGSTNALISECTLAKYEDGESQVLEVLADAVQSTPPRAVQDAWDGAPVGGM